MQFKSNFLIQMTFVLILLQSNAGGCSRLYQFVKNKASVEENLKNFLENVRNRMCHPISKLSLPALDPFKLNTVPYNLTSDAANLDVLVRNANATGLSDFVIKDLKLNRLTRKVVVDLYVPLQDCDVSYKVNGSITGLFDVNGQGDISVALQKVGFQFEGKINLFKPLRLSVKKLEPYIANFQFHIANLFPDPEVNEFVNKMVRDLAPQFATEIWLKQKPHIIAEIEKIASDKMKNMNLAELLKLIADLEHFFDKTDPEPNCKYNQTKR